MSTLHPNITTAFTKDETYEARKYGIKLLLDPPEQNPELKKRFNDAENKNPSRLLDQRKSDDSIERSFSPDGKFAHIKITSETFDNVEVKAAAQFKAPGTFGVFGKSKVAAPAENIVNPELIPTNTPSKK